MLLLPDTPTYEEWIALLHDRPDQAQALAEALRAQIKKQGLSADAALEISAHEYVRARQWIAAVSDDVTKQAQLRQYVDTGRATMAPPPDEQQWRAMLDTDPIAARQLFVAFERKQAVLGISTSRAISTSIAIYQQLVGRKA